MQSVAAASAVRVDQRRCKVVSAEEPLEGARRMSFPTWIAVRAPGGKAGRDARGRLERLLIERERGPAQMTEALRADGPEKSVLRGLQRHDPAQRSQSGRAVVRGAQGASRH